LSDRWIVDNHPMRMLAWVGHRVTHDLRDEVYHKLQKEALLSGIARTYRPKDEEGEPLPPEQKKVHYRVQDALSDAKAALVELFNIVATQDTANTKARGNIVVDGTAVLSNVPVTHLLFLEKQEDSICKKIETSK